MPTLVRVSCPVCSQMSDLPTDEILLDVDDEEDYVLHYSCAHCRSFVSRQISEKQVAKLQKAGVFTVEEMGQWIVEELEDTDGQAT